MRIRVETSSGMPITRQIAAQIRAQCASRALKPGDRLPSVRAWPPNWPSIRTRSSASTSG